MVVVAAAVAVVHILVVPVDMYIVAQLVLHIQVVVVRHRSSFGFVAVVDSSHSAVVLRNCFAVALPAALRSCFVAVVVDM